MYFLDNLIAKVFSSVILNSFSVIPDLIRRCLLDKRNLLVWIPAFPPRGLASLKRRAGMTSEGLRMTRKFSHQKTALASGFNASVVDKPTIVPQTELSTIYQKIVRMSNFKKCLRGPDGNRTRSFCLRNRWSTISLPAQLTEAILLFQIRN